MTTPDMNPSTQPTDPRPLGYWLAAISPRLRAQLREALAEADLGRRDWRVMTHLRRGPAALDAIERAMPPRPGRHDRPSHGQDHEHEHEHEHRPEHRRRRTVSEVLNGLVERGWLHTGEDGYALTDEGRRQHDVLLQRVTEVRAAVRDGIPDADWTTTMRTLERIAANLGVDPDAPRPHREHARGPWRDIHGRKPHPRRPVDPR